MGKYDVPASIDYVLKITSHEKLHYVVYSMGGTQFMAGLSLRPEYSEKLRLGILIAPSIFGQTMLYGLAQLSLPFTQLAKVK